MKKGIFVSLIALLGGCALPVSEQVNVVDECMESQLDFEITTNFFGNITKVECVKLSNAESGTL